MTTITAVGNEGFRVATPAATVLVDAFYETIPGVSIAPALRPADVGRANLLLVTHAHWDHFAADAVAEAAHRSGARVGGPGSALSALEGRVPPERLVPLDPPRTMGRRPAEWVTAELPGVTVTAFRTFHGRQHNSYLVESGGFRWFHDGDNENTRRLPLERIAPLDALLIAPWQGSGWCECIERLAPRRWFLMHLAAEELDAHQAGRFLPDLCDRVPDGLVCLRPGESWSDGPAGA